MKTYEEVKYARYCVVKALLIPGISEEQQAALDGVSVALQWVCDDGGSALQMLIDGVPINPKGGA